MVYATLFITFLLAFISVCGVFGVNLVDRRILPFISVYGVGIFLSPSGPTPVGTAVVVVLINCIIFWVVSFFWCTGLFDAPEIGTEDDG